MSSLTRMLLAALVALAFALPAGAQVPADAQPGDFLESEYAVKAETGQDREAVRQGGEFLLTLRLTPYVGENFGFHFYGTQQTGNPNYMASVFAMDAADGVSFDVDYPEGELKQDSGGDMYVLEGQQIVQIRGRVAENATPGPRTFKATYLFNVCTDDMCLQPSQIEYTWPLSIEPAAFNESIPVIPEDQLLASTEFSADQWHLPTQSGAEDDAGGLDFLDELDDDGAAGALALDNITPQDGASDGLSLEKALLFAFLGGLILNFMPCVLPVVSIKVISLARHAQESPGMVVRQGLVFCLGIISTFLLLALIVNILQAGGAQLGWGFQFQNPWFLLVMCAIIFAFGLSLAGVYTIKPPQSLTGAGEKLSEKEGYGGSFFKGVLATVLGTPCVGPFLGPALGYAFTQSPAAVWGIFGAVGLGMALPYAALVANPKFLGMGQRERGKLTRSIMDAKNWLVDFERVMAFVLFATVLYLLSILGGSLGAQAVVWAMAFLLGLAFALWLWGRLITGGRRGIMAGLILGPALIAATGFVTLPRMEPTPVVVSSDHLAWVDYSEDALMTHLSEGRTVLIDFTADWCPNCKYNEATALNIPATRELIEELDVVPMMADWTARDEAIGTMLRRLGRSSIPLTAIFPAATPSQPILLDGVFTAARVQDELRRAHGQTPERVAEAR